MPPSERSFIISRVPFRIPLGGGSTDMPSYYAEHGGFIFAVAIDLYMDIFIKEPIVDDNIHMHYMHYESETSVDDVKHTIGREALRMVGLKDKVLISFKADTPAGTGLGSSGACSVALLKGLSLYTGRSLSNIEAAEQAFVLTQNLKLPDGKQDPYACSIGGFSVLEIAQDGTVDVSKPVISTDTVQRFLDSALLFYTGIRRDSKPILSAQSSASVLEMKHRTKEIGRKVLECFVNGDLDTFGNLLDEHWQVKRGMAEGMTSDMLDAVYVAARAGGALGGKILGAGGGGYFLLYCPTVESRQSVREAMKQFNLREVHFGVDDQGARASIFKF